MPRRRSLLSPRWLALHALTVVLAVAFLALGWWQWQRGEAGNTRSFAYALQWPTFALFVCFMWWSIVRHERRGRDPVPASGDHATRPPSVEATTSGRRQSDQDTAPPDRTGRSGRIGHPVGVAAATPASTTPVVAAAPEGGGHGTEPVAVTDEDDVTPLEPEPVPAAVGGAGLPRVALRAAARRSRQDTPVDGHDGRIRREDEGGSSEDDENLAAYNRYLARLNAGTAPVTGQATSTTRGKEGA